MKLSHVRQARLARIELLSYLLKQVNDRIVTLQKYVRLGVAHDQDKQGLDLDLRTKMQFEREFERLTGCDAEVIL